ncbi:MAG: hypothetical protein LBQ54_01565 [Planctomycetaceae bacterium]|jgi:photosystem II stability/assembly factor-like uncharacterized protein|nr:hypothetical protein [Planctomycetaceae bacterium]
MTSLLRTLFSLLLILLVPFHAQAQLSQSVLEEFRAQYKTQQAAEKKSVPTAAPADTAVSPHVTSAPVAAPPSAALPAQTFPPPAPPFTPPSASSVVSPEEDEIPSMGLAKYNPGRLPQASLPMNSPVLEQGFLLERRGDARLNGLCFVNRNHAWAVGDLGTIWHTQDGGRTWTLQESGTDAPLYGVHFLDENTGVAVGGRTMPYSHVGQGIFLKTVDGGGTWQRLPIYSAPILHQVKMFDAKTIQAAGCASEYYPGGILYTLNGGQEWMTVAGGKSRGWSSLEMDHIQTGTGIGLDGSIQMIRNTPQLSRTPSPGLRRAAGLSVFPFRQTQEGMISGWLVGEGGLVMNTPDTGTTWQIPRNPLPLNHPELFDGNTVFGNGPHVWIAGKPGTRIFHSSNAGVTWESAPTGITAPIRKICFIDPLQGCAVGELGTILVTSDGGKSWQISRTGGERLAVLGLFARYQDVPFEILTQLCLEEGFLGGVELLLRQESFEYDGGEVSAGERLQEAVAHCGGNVSSQAWAFTLDHDEMQCSAAKIMERLERENDGRGLERFREKLVCLIRMWRPDLILTTDPNSANGDAVRDFTAREVLFAVKNAADPMRYPEQMTESGLSPWQVNRVQMVTDPKWKGSSAAAIKLPTQTLSPRIGKSLYEVGRFARSLVLREEMGIPSSVSLMNGFDLQGMMNQRLMTGIALSGHRGARRNLQYSMTDSYELLQSQMQKQSHALGIAAGDTGNHDRLLGNVTALTEGLFPNAAVNVLLEMGKRFTEKGDLESAAEIYSRLNSFYPKHPYTSKAAFWLAQYYSAQETFWRLKHDQAIANPDPAIQTVSFEKTMDRIDKGSQAVRQLTANAAELGNDPRIRFALAASQRSHMMPHLAMPYYSARSRKPGDDVWSVRAQGELWLAVPDKSTLPPGQQECPLPIILCRFAQDRPFLDGKFDDNIWNTGVPVSLSPPVADHHKVAQVTYKVHAGGETIEIPKSPELLAREEFAAKSLPLGTQMLFLYDRQFLYIGIRCPKIPGYDYLSYDERLVKVRDSDLSAKDRLEILLDIDRDYSVYHQFEIDAQGLAKDTSWHNLSWNPMWFFAHGKDDLYWYAECAVPLACLMERPPQSNDVIGIALRRLVPGVGAEVWNAENSFNTREAFGYLVFE